MGFFGSKREAEPESTSVQKEYQRAKMTGWRDTIICALVIVAVILAKDAIVGGDFSPVLGETEFSIMLPSGEQRTIVYEELESLEYREIDSIDRGELVEGEEGRRCWSGVYHNEEYGEYEMYVLSRLDTCIVAHTTDRVYVFNMESDDTTKILYDFLLDESQASDEFAGNVS